MIDWVNVPSEDTKITRNGPTGNYKASNHATREFCQTCGTSLFFFDDEEPDIVDVTIASITTPNVFDYVEFNGHIWVEDVRHLVLDETGKGGGLTTIMNDGLPLWKQNREGEPFDYSINQALEPSKDISGIPGRCRCGAIKYELPIPPTAEVAPFDIPSKQMVVPPSMQRYPQRGSRPNSNKWRAGHCHCKACTGTVGATVVDWVDVPLQEVKVVRDGPTGVYTITSYAKREFCQTCGASLFLVYEADNIAAVSIASITTPNVFDFVEYTEHTWMDDVDSHVLDEAGRGGGLAGVMNDGLPKMRRNRSGERWNAIPL